MKISKSKSQSKLEYSLPKTDEKYLQKKFDSLTSHQGRQEFIRLYGHPHQYKKNLQKSDSKNQTNKKLRTWKKFGDSPKQAYQNYILSKEWKAFRRQLIKKRGKRCEHCGRIRYLYLYHKNLRNLYNEVERDVELICDRCRKELHQRRKIKK